MATLAEQWREEARHAAEAAERAQGAAARAWLERAHRLVPSDAAIGMRLAQAIFVEGAFPAAARLLEDVVAKAPLREAWWMLATARLALGDARGAATALAHALRNYRLPGKVPPVADAVARAACLPGWCGFGPRGPVGMALAGMPPAKRRAEGGGIAFRSAGTALLGSPLDPTMLARVEGVVHAEGRALVGWAWHPADPDRDPQLTLRGEGWVRRVTAADRSVLAPRPLMQVRGFRIPLGRREAGGPISVAAGDQPLSGSPLDPFSEHRAARLHAQALARAYPLAGRARPTPPFAVHADIMGWPAAAPSRPKRPVAVVVPVHATGGAANRAATLACLAALAVLPRESALILVDDASTDAPVLEALAARPKTILLRHRNNLGFCATANAGLRAAWRLAPACDVVLLNSDTLPAPGWIERLRAAVHAAPEIGTASPLSNAATILSYPFADRNNPFPADVAAMGALAAATDGAAVEVPTGVGFCLYIRRECLAETGLLRADQFAQGYGEENDFCRRAAWLGWRHIAVPRAYVAHHGGGSFGHATLSLARRNTAAMERLHPGYGEAIASWVARDPLAPARRALDARRLAAGKPQRTVLLITHDDGGGVEQAVRLRIAELRAAGHDALLLRPVLAGNGLGEERYRRGHARLDDAKKAFPNLIFRLPEEAAALHALLRRARVEAVEIHHLLGHDRAVVDLASALAVPLAWHIHDYAALCPRVTFSLPDGRYCGEPAEIAACEACIADHGRRDGREIPVAALRAETAAALAKAPAIVPSADVAARFARHCPGITPEVAAPGHDTELPPLVTPPPAERRRIVVPGAIGPEKGYDVLLGCARDAAQRDLPMEFVVVGYSLDDRRLLETGRAWVTGQYAEDEAEALLRAQAGALAFIPSTCPETWCFALSLAWQAGLAACAFDLGAQAGRIRASGRGFLLPLGLPPQRINASLLAADPLALRNG